MSIIVIAGRPRHGKGLYALKLMMDEAARGRPVYTNVEILPKCPMYHRIAQIGDAENKFPVFDNEPKKEFRAFWHYTIPGSLVVIDEADHHFDCSDFGVIGRSAKQFFKMHGKLGYDIVMIVQKVQNLWARIRRLTEKFILCEWTWRSRPLMQQLGVPITWSKWLRYEFADENFRELVDTRYLWYSEGAAYFNMWNTRQIIGDPLTVQDKPWEQRRTV